MKRKEVIEKINTELDKQYAITTHFYQGGRVAQTKDTWYYYDTITLPREVGLEIVRLLEKKK